jgi:hypothetical protein
MPIILCKYFCLCFNKLVLHWTIVLSVITLKVRAIVIAQVTLGLATRLLGEQSATEVKVLDEVSQNYQKVQVLTEKLRKLLCGVRRKNQLHGNRGKGKLT